MEEQIAETALELMGKPIYTMTGEEFMTLFGYVAQCGDEEDGNKKKGVAYLYGVIELAEYLGCAPSTVSAMKRRGVLEDAIVSRIGKRIVFNGNKAKELAHDYQVSQRRNRLKYTKA